MFNENNVKGDEAASIDLCLSQLGVDQVDLLLIHNPCTGVDECVHLCAFLRSFFENQKP